MSNTNDRGNSLK